MHTDESKTTSSPVHSSSYMNELRAKLHERKRKPIYAKRDGRDQAAPDAEYLWEKASTVGDAGHEERDWQPDGNITNLRHSPQTSHDLAQDRAFVQHDDATVDNRADRQMVERPLVSQMMNDIWNLVLPFPTVVRVSYPVWKWLLLLYLGWMIVSHSVALIYSSFMSKVAPMCSIPIVGPQLPFCTPVFDARDRTANFTKMTDSQGEFTIVMDHVGQNFDLARDMVGHEFAVRDLRIRVAVSELARRKELARELDSLIRYTKQTAKSLSRFTAKVGKSIDTVKIFDDYAVKSLEGIAERERHHPSLSGQVLSAVSPFSAFSVGKAGPTEEQVKHVFITTAVRISDKVKLLIDDSFDLSHSLDSIQETLERIKELASEELGDLPQMNVLGALWASLARPDDYEQHKSHSTLLTDMTAFYKASSDVMKETNAALNRIEAELGEFRDDLATPALTLTNEPLDVVIALLRKSAHRLESGMTSLGQVESGERPRQRTIQRTGNVKTVTVN